MKEKHDSVSLINPGSIIPPQAQKDMISRFKRRLGHLGPTGTAWSIKEALAMTKPGSVVVSATFFDLGCDENEIKGNMRLILAGGRTVMCVKEAVLFDRFPLLAPVRWRTWESMGMADADCMADAVSGFSSVTDLADLVPYERRLFIARERLAGENAWFTPGPVM